MRWLLLLLVGCGSAVGADEPISQAPPGFWDHWGDGTAELAGYTLRQPRYGELRSGEAVLITVTEDFTKGQRVKSDGGRGDEYPVIKLNEVRDFQTGVYDHNLMSSAFVPLDGSVPRGVATKTSFSMQEWCGAVWEQVGFEPPMWALTGHSYFDGEGDVELSGKLPPNALVEDAMPLLVRGVAGELLAAGDSKTVTVLESAGRRRMAHQAAPWTSGRLSRSAGHREVRVPAGSFVVEEWTLALGPASRTWWVEVAAPHRIIGWTGNDGEQAQLTGVVRAPYWNQHANRDEGLRKQLGLPTRAWPEPKP